MVDGISLSINSVILTLKSHAFVASIQVRMFDSGYLPTYYITQTDSWTVRLSDERTDGPSDGMTDERTDGLSDGQTDWLTDWLSDGRTDELTDWWVDKWMYRRTDWQADGLTDSDGQGDGRADWLTDWHLRPVLKNFFYESTFAVS